MLILISMSISISISASISNSISLSISISISIPISIQISIPISKLSIPIFKHIPRRFARAFLHLDIYIVSLKCLIRDRVVLIETYQVASAGGYPESCPKLSGRLIRSLIRNLSGLLLAGGSAAAAVAFRRWRLGAGSIAGSAVVPQQECDACDCYPLGW